MLQGGCDVIRVCVCAVTGVHVCDITEVCVCV